MEVTEGTALGMMKYMYTFDYLRDDVILSHITQAELVELWRSNLLDHFESIQLSLYVANNLMLDRSELKVDYWTTNNLRFLLTRITEYREKIRELGGLLMAKVNHDEPANVDKMNAL